MDSRGSVCTLGVCVSVEVDLQYTYVLVKAVLKF